MLVLPQHLHSQVTVLPDPALFLGAAFMCEADAVQRPAAPRAGRVFWLRDTETALSTFLKGWRVIAVRRGFPSDLTPH